MSINKKKKILEALKLKLLLLNIEKSSPKSYHTLIKILLNYMKFSMRKYVKNKKNKVMMISKKLH